MTTPVPNAAATAGVVPLPLSELAEVGDPFLRWQIDLSLPTAAFRCGAAVGWLTPFERPPLRTWLDIIGPVEDAAALIAAVYPDREAHVLRGMTVPTGSHLLVPGLRLDPPHDWEWMWTDAAPPVQPGEEQVAWLPALDDGEAESLTAFLNEHSPRHSAKPGDAEVVAWAGIRDDRGWAAVVAHTRNDAGMPHLASVVTRCDLRGRGLGAAVTAWVTRQLLADGQPVVTLGMYADNDVARRMYQRLGFHDDHFFTSGRLVN